MPVSFLPEQLNRRRREDPNQGRRVRGKSNGFLNLFPRERYPWEKEDEEQPFESQEDLLQKLLASRADIQPSPVSGDMTAPYTPEMAQKADKSKLRELLTQQSTDKKTGVTTRGIPVSELSKWGIETRQDLVDKGVLKKGEILEGAQESSPEGTYFTGNVYITKPSRSATVYESFRGQDATGLAGISQRVADLANKEIFNIKGVGLSSGDIAGLALIGYGIKEGVTKIAQPLFNRAVATEEVNTLLKSRGIEASKDKVNSFVNMVERYIKPSDTLKAFAQRGQVGGGQPGELIPFNKGVPANINPALQANIAKAGNIPSKIAPVVGQTAQAVGAGRMQLTPEGQAPKAGAVTPLQPLTPSQPSPAAPQSTPEALAAQGRENVPAAPPQQAATPIQPQQAVPPGEPPAVPPAEPPAPPVSAPVPQPAQPSKSAMSKVMQQSQEMVKQDRPTGLTKILQRIPGIKQVMEFERPGLRLTEDKEKILISYIAENQARVDVNTRANSTYFDSIKSLDNAFGKGATEGKKLDIRFTGTPAEAQNPITGKLKDIVENPELYSLSTEQLQAIANLERRNTELLNYVVDGYGTEIGHFPAKPKGAFLSNVDISEEAIEKIGNELRAVASGRQKERFYPTARERMKSDPTFKPELNIQKLIYGMDSAKAKAASGETFRAGIEGKTREEVMQETHPELYAKMTALKTRLASLRGSAGRLDDKLDKAIADFMQSPAEGTDLLELQSSLDVKLQSGPRKGLGIEDIQKAIDEVRAEIKKLRPAWEIANLKPYEFVQEGIYRYFKSPEAKEIRDLLKRSNNGFLNIVEGIRGTAFSGDLSPIVGVQTPLGIFFDPIGAFTMAGGGIEKALKTGNPLVSFSVSEFAKDIAKDPEGYAQFFSLLGRSPGGTPAEYAGGYLSKIPGFSEFTEATFLIVTRQAYGLYERTWTSLVKAGIPELQAKVSAITTTAKVFPFVSPSRLGQSPARAALMRTLPTSYSFIRQTATMFNDAVNGLGNILSFKRPTPTQGNALRLLMQLAASLMVTAALSQAYDAHRNKRDVNKAILDAINPDPRNGKFLSIVYGKYRIPIGGPYRSLFRAMYPQKVSGVDIPIPFAGMFNYFKNRITPLIGTQIDLLQNKDYYGKKIRSGDIPTQIWQTLQYEIEGALPLTAGSALEGWWRTGATGEEIATEAVSQFAGTTLIQSPTYEVNNLREQYSQKDYGKTYEELNKNEKTELERKHTDLKKLAEEAKDFYLRRGDELDAVSSMLDEEATVKRDTDINKVAQSLMDGAITKYEYDKERSYVRPYYSGQRNALFQMKDKLDPEQGKQIEEYKEKFYKPEDKALDAYWDYYDQVVESTPLPKDWDAINAQLDSWLAQYNKKTQDYIKKNLNDWIQDLPEPAKTIELERLYGIEDGSWWDNYRGNTAKYPWEKSTSTSAREKFPWEK